MKLRNIIIPVLCLAMLALTGCGKSSSDEAITTSTTTQPTTQPSTGGVTTQTAPTTGNIKFSTIGANAIGALDMTIDLPAGVTVDADAATGEVAAGTVTISGVAANGTGQVAAKVASGKVTISMIDTTGFGSGECVTIHFKVADGGTFPADTATFTATVTGAMATDGKTPINGVTAAPATLTADS